MMTNPHRRANVYTGPIITVAEYQRLEIKRYLDAETPGKFGYFTNREVTS